MRHIVKNQITVLDVEFPSIVGVSRAPRRAIVIYQFPESRIVFGLLLRARNLKRKQYSQRKRRTQ